MGRPRRCLQGLRSCLQGFWSCASQRSDGSAGTCIPYFDSILYPIPYYRLYPISYPIFLTVTHLVSCTDSTWERTGAQGWQPPEVLTHHAPWIEGRSGARAPSALPPGKQQSCERPHPQRQRRRGKQLPPAPAAPPPAAATARRLRVPGRAPDSHPAWKPGHALPDAFRRRGGAQAFQQQHHMQQDSQVGRVRASTRPTTVTAEAAFHRSGCRRRFKSNNGSGERQSASSEQ